MLSFLTSAFFFSIGYRQTLGASAEKAKTANENLEKAIVRRLLNDSYLPTFQDIQDLRKILSIDSSIDPARIRQPSVLLKSIFHQVFDSDYLSSELRINTLGQLRDMIDDAQSLETQEQAMLKSELLARALLGVVAVLAGVALYLFAFSSADIEISGLQAGLISTLTVMLVLGMSVVSSDKQITEPSSTTHLKRHSFHSDVVKVLETLGETVKVEQCSFEKNHDFDVTIADSTFALRLATWDEYPPKEALMELTAELLEVCRLQNAKSSALVVDTAATPPEYVPDELNIVLINDLSDWVLSQSVRN